MSEATVGSLLQYWRRGRHLSQLALALQAEISPRHLSFLETGRARPSREMVLRLASVLDVPLRERNALLLAAGFAPTYTESRLEAPVLASVREALDAILRQQEPFPAVVINRHWDVLMTNEGASRFFGFLLDGATSTVPSQARPNILRMMFDPRALRPFVTNWESVAESLIARAHREAVGGVPDEALLELLKEILAYPGVSPSWARPHLEPLLPVVPVIFRKDDRTFRFFSTVTTLGTPQDVTLQEIRIECFFPVDEDTRRHTHALSSTD